MRLDDMNTGFFNYRNLVSLSVVPAMLLFSSLMACSTPKPKPLPPTYKPAETADLHFKRPLIIETPERDPVTIEEHILCGLFYFDRERFAEAADEFEKARRGIGHPWNNLNRACLMSEATCYLLTDNKEAFVKTVDELKCTYSSYQLITIQKRDCRVKAIFELYNEFMKTGNY